MSECDKDCGCEKHEDDTSSINDGMSPESAQQIEEIVNSLPNIPVNRQLSNPLKAMGLGRNSPCPCGSEKKFKKCCLDKLQG